MLSNNVYYTTEPYKPRIRVFIEIKQLQRQFTMILDKAKHHMDLDSFVKEVCTRVEVQHDSTKMMYLPPNH
jgi:hypothetical protein